MKYQKKIRTLVLSMFMASCFIGAVTSIAKAQDTAEPQGLIPAQNTVTVDADTAVSSETHPPLRLTPDKSEIINVDEEVERVIIGNDTHVNIFLDSATRLIAVPRAPGATHFSIMGKDGKIIMQRHVIVASPKQDYVRIRRSCSLSDGDCAPTRVYYCPGMCHEIGLAEGGTSGGQSGISISSPDPGSATSNAFDGAPSPQTGNNEE